MANDGIRITAPVGSEDIATVIGDASDMSKSENVNTWAKYKPFEPWHSQIYRPQEDADRRDAAWGFYWWNHTKEEEAPFASNAKDLLEKAITNNGKWKWKKPISNDRFGDFDGYNHRAQPPYAYSGTQAAAQNPKYLMVTSDPGDTNIEIRLSDMPDFTGDWDMPMTDLRIVAIYRNKISNGAVTVVDTGMTIGNLDVYPFTVESGAIALPSEGKYDIIWAATNYYDVESGEPELWMYLPNSLATLTLEAGLIIGFEWGSGEFEAYDDSGNQITTDSGIVSSMQFYLNGKNNFGYDLDIEYIFKVWNRSDSSQGYEFAYTAEQYQETVGNYFAPLSSEIIINTAEVAAKPSDCMVTLDIRSRRSGSQDTWSVKHYNFLTEQIEPYASTEADGVSVWDIIQYTNSR